LLLGLIFPFFPSARRCCLIFRRPFNPFAPILFSLDLSLSHFSEGVLFGLPFPVRKNVIGTFDRPDRPYFFLVILRSSYPLCDPALKRPGTRFFFLRKPFGPLRPPAGYLAPTRAFFSLCIRPPAKPLLGALLNYPSVAWSLILFSFAQAPCFPFLSSGSSAVSTVKL